VPRARTEHAQLHKQIVITEGAHPESGGRILCAWMDCERPGYSLYVIRIDEGAPGHPKVVRYAFCSERHRQYFAHSHRDFGKLPPGLGRLVAPR